MTKKKPAALIPQVGLTATQRKSIGAGVYAPRIKEQGEAGPITFKSSKLIGIPRIDSVRPGANDHALIRSRGYQC